MRRGQLIAGRFEISDPGEDLIGRGGMADVYRGTDTQTGETVAIKALKLDAVSHDAELVARFAREGEALRQLDHPNIVNMVAAIEEDGGHYLIMEHVAGGSLEELIAEEGALPFGRALEISLDLADALTRAHRLGIVHRDLKPANVLLADDGTPRLTDFGIAYLEERSRLTQSEVVMGTLHYLSPGACDLEPVDARSDIWALGVMLFEMLTGERPFRGEMPTAIIAAILTQPVPDLAQLCPDLPAALVELVNWMLEKERARRIPSARMVGAELERMQGGELSEGRRFATPTPAPRGSRQKLPQDLTPFVGRKAELARIEERLADPDCRLLTLVGPGGSGKTRLAIEAAAAQAAELEHGVAFVPLAPLKSAEAIVPTVAEAVGLTFYKASEIEGVAEVEPQGQLLDYLRQKRLLLVMDNYEHLLTPAGAGGADGVELVSEILKNAPGVKILATSRERLNVGGEGRFPVSGMAYPRAEHEDPAGCSAVQLFLECARRARPGFELTEENVSGVVEVCRLVEGMPLAIQLAAAWVEMLSPAEIAAEIGRSLDLLETEVRDVPGRQRSMRAVLDHSWRTLTERERSLTGALSVFRGGFSREAAEAVTGAGLRDLMGLVNKSLLHRGAIGRYEIHELTRQYAAEILETQKEAWERANDDYSAYYAAALERWGVDLRSARQVAALEEMDREIKNARAAWEWAAERGQVELLDQALEGLCYYYDYRRRGQELESACRLAAGVLTAMVTGDELFSSSNPSPAEGPAPVQHPLRGQGTSTAEGPVLSSAEGTRVLARILAWQGWAVPSHKLDRQWVAGSLELLERPELAGKDTRREKAFALLRMGVLTANLDLKGRLYDQSLNLYKELGDQWWTANVLLPMCARDIVRGSIDSANQVALDSLDIYRTLGDHRGRARALEHLSNIAYRRNQQEEAIRRARELVAVGREIEDQGIVANGLYHLAIATNASGRWAEGLALLDESAAIRHEMGMGQEGRAFVPCWTRVNLGQYEEVLAEGEGHLALARKWGNRHDIASWLAMLGSTALATKAYADARKLLQEGIEIMRDVGLRDDLGVWLPSLAIAHLALGEQRQAEVCLREAVQLAVGAGDHSVRYLALLGVALLRVDQGEGERAVELHALGSCHPAWVNGRWFQDVLGARIAAVAETLPPDVVAAARERGRARDLGETIAELVAELGEGPAEEE